MMVLFLTGLVSVILLRTIKRDYARYDREEGLADFVCIEIKRISVLPMQTICFATLRKKGNSHSYILLYNT